MKLATLRGGPAALKGRARHPGSSRACTVGASKGTPAPKDGAGRKAHPGGRPIPGKALAKDNSKAGQTSPRVADRSVSPLVLKWETEQGTLLVGSDGPLQADKPGNGGLRLWSYSTLDDAVSECEALSSGMSGKHSVYNTGFSGANFALSNAREQGFRMAVLAVPSDISSAQGDALRAKGFRLVGQLTEYYGSGLGQDWWTHDLAS